MAITREQRADQKRVAKEWKTFRKKYFFSQVQLAEHLGISRRAVQYTESGKGQSPDWPCLPMPETLAKFAALKKRYEKEGK